MTTTIQCNESVKNIYTLVRINEAFQIFHHALHSPLHGIDGILLIITIIIVIIITK